MDASVSALAERTGAHLDFVHRLITAHLPPIIGAARRDELLDRLDAIRPAGADLRVAMLGEFSSGKTMLINALLRDRLLPVSARECTAVPTEIHPGHRFSVGVREAPDGPWHHIGPDLLRNCPIWTIRACSPR